MLINWGEGYVPKYKDAKKHFFERYDRKINAIISNINDNSLSNKDKAVLKKRLANKLLDSL